MIPLLGKFCIYKEMRVSVNLKNSWLFFQQKQLYSGTAKNCIPGHTSSSKTTEERRLFYRERAGSSGWDGGNLLRKKPIGGNWSLCVVAAHWLSGGSLPLAVAGGGRNLPSSSLVGK